MPEAADDIVLTHTVSPVPQEVGPSRAALSTTK
jgi:hypothetical protein